MVPDGATFEIWRTAILVCSAIAWIVSRRLQTSPTPPPALNIRLLDYMIFIWIFLMAFLAVQTTAQMFFSMEGTEGQSDEWDIILGSLSLQIPMLSVMLLALANQKLPFSHSDINQGGQNVLREMRVGFQVFLMFLPVIWIVSILWIFLLKTGRGLLSADDLEVQGVVTTLSEVSDPVPLIILALLIILVAPIAEEFFFRGSIYRYAKNALGPRQAMAISAIIFACAHFNLRAMVPLFVMGMFLAWIYERRGNIWAPIAFHAAFNTQSFVLIFILRGQGA